MPMPLPPAYGSQKLPGALDGAVEIAPGYHRRLPRGSA